MALSYVNPKSILEVMVAKCIRSTVNMWYLNKYYYLQQLFECGLICPTYQKYTNKHVQQQRQLMLVSYVINSMEIHHRMWQHMLTSAGLSMRCYCNMWGLRYEGLSQIIWVIFFWGSGSIEGNVGRFLHHYTLEISDSEYKSYS